MTQVAITPQRFDNRQLEIMKATVAKELSTAEFAFFLEVCKHRNLNPFNREIYAFSNKQGKLNIQVSIDGLRLIAERSGKYKGQLGPFYCAEDGVWVDVWLSKTPPAAAKVGVRRTGFDDPIWAVARFESYAQTTQVWVKMPDLMLAKCAESLALRRAFPAEMGGLYSHEEMEQSGNVVVESVAPSSARLNALYAKGKEKGMWSEQGGFCTFVSVVTGFNVTRETIYDLVEDQFLQIEQAIDEEPALAK